MKIKNKSVLKIICIIEFVIFFSLVVFFGILLLSKKNFFSNSYYTFFLTSSLVFSIFIFINLFIVFGIVKNKYYNYSFIFVSKLNILVLLTLFVNFIFTNLEFLPSFSFTSIKHIIDGVLFLMLLSYILITLDILFPKKDK